MSGLLISAAWRSSGKTTVATGLIAGLVERGLAVQPFKKGPDYIDPQWLGLAAGRPCRNLDLHLQGGAEVAAYWARHAAACDVAVVEGNLGLHDGMDLEGATGREEAGAFLDRGGIRLARAPESIRIGEVVRATEGDAPIVECLSDDPDACRIAGRCRLTRVLVDAFEALYAPLDRHTLADLTANPAALAAVLVHRPDRGVDRATRRVAARAR